MTTTDIDNPLTNQAREKYDAEQIKKGIYELITPATKNITEKEPAWHDFK